MVFAYMSGGQKDFLLAIEYVAFGPMYDLEKLLMKTFPKFQSIFWQHHPSALFLNNSLILN